MKYKPKYIELAKSGALKKLAEITHDMMKDCQLCPHKCKIDRIEGNLGICKTGAHAKVANYDPHFGEEAALVGKNGSGTIFFSQCNMHCNFCQNYDISHSSIEQKSEPADLAKIMIYLQEVGCHNINFVTPTHVVPQILAAVDIAVTKGLEIPLVYNSGGYDSLNTLRFLDGVIDIYMPDFKFWNNNVAKMTCNIQDYKEIACQAIKEMHRQVGDLVIDKNGIAQKGLLVRHLVLPENLANTEEVMKFIKEEISENTFVNIMDQYTPYGEAQNNEYLSRKITTQEYKEAIEMARKAGLKMFS